MFNNQSDINDTLNKFGYWLDDIDNCEELNQAGFNKFDKAYWQDIDPNDNLALMRILKKYKRQLTDQFGKEYEECGLGSFVEKTTSLVGNILDETDGREFDEIRQLVVELQGKRVSKDVFASLTELYKGNGFKFHAKTKQWRLPETKWKKFDYDRYDINNRFEQKLLSLDIKIDYLPYLGTSMREEDEPGYKSNLEITYNENTKLFSIAFDYDYLALEFFANDSGKLSGITEYNESARTRETYSLALVNEIIEKFKKEEDFEDWNVNVCSQLKQLNKDEAKRQKGFQKSHPKIARKLAKGMKLFPYQNEGVDFLDETDGKALIGYQMGLGKTLTSLAWCVKHNLRALVVCPKTVRRVWVNEAEKFFPSHFKTLELTPKLKSQKIDLNKFDLVSVNYESFRSFSGGIKRGDFDVLILDESHRIKSHKTGISQLVNNNADKFKHKILLSGTTVKNKKVEIYNQINLLDPYLFEHRQEVARMTTGGLWNKIQCRYTSKLKKDVLKDLPDIQTTIMKEKMKGLPDSRGFAIEQISRYKAEVAVAKAPHTVEFVNEILDSSDSNVLLFTDSVLAAKTMTKLLGKKAVLHYGQMSDNDREEVKTAFQERRTPARVFVTTRQSFAVGVTLTAADKVVFNDLPWNPADVMQAEARVHRIGQKNNVNVYWIEAEGNDFDKLVTSIMFRKYELTKQINEGKQLSAKDAKWMKEPVDLGSIFKGGRKGKLKLVDLVEYQTEAEVMEVSKIEEAEAEVIESLPEISEVIQKAITNKKTHKKEKPMTTLNVNDLTADLNRVFKKHGLLIELKTKATPKIDKAPKAKKVKIKAKVKAKKKKTTKKSKLLSVVKYTQRSGKATAHTSGDMLAADIELFKVMVKENVKLAKIGPSQAKKYEEAMSAHRLKKVQPHPGYIKKVHSMIL